MNEKAEKPNCGQVRTTFSLGKRGIVLVLEHLCTGIIPSNGIMHYAGSKFKYKGPEIIDSFNDKDGYPCIIIEDKEVLDILHVGSTIIFSELP